MLKNKTFATALAFAAIMLSSCASMPTITNSNVPPEFAEQIRNADRFPDVADAPSAPTDIPRTTVWDAKARKMMRAKGGFENIDAPAGDISAVILREIQALTLLVNEHKLDDPK